MRRTAKLNLFIYLLSVCFSFSLNQEQAIAVSDDSKNKPAKIKTIYDKSKDETTVVLMPLTVSERPGTIDASFPADGATSRRLPSLSLQMTAYFSFPGKTLTPPTEVALGFLSLSENKIKFANDRDLTVIADGGEINLGEMRVVDRHIDSGIQLRNATFYREALELAVSSQVFLRIANAKKVTVRLGKNEFELPARQLVSFRALANKMQG